MLNSGRGAPLLLVAMFSGCVDELRNGKVSRGEYRGRRGRKGGQGSWTPVERMVDVPFPSPLSRRSCDRDDSHDCFARETRQAHTNILVTNGWIQCISGGGAGILPRERKVSKKQAAPTRRSRLWKVGLDFLMIRECDYCTIPTNSDCHCHQGVRPPDFWLGVIGHQGSAARFESMSSGGPPSS